MKSPASLFAWIVAVSIATPVSAAGLLDRIKEKAEEAARSTREVTRDVEAVTNADERAAAEARGAVGQVEAAVDVEGRVRAGAADTELGRSATQTESAVRGAQYEIERAASTDERAQQTVENRIDSTVAEIDRRTDVQAQAETAVRQSEVGTAATGVEREVDAAGRAVRDPVGTAQQGVDRETGGAVRAVQDAGNAVRELGSALD
jgi:hypothetical protein